MTGVVAPSALNGALADIVANSASPGVVSQALGRMARAEASLTQRLEDEPATAGALVAVLAASRSMARLCETRTLDALDILAHLDRRPSLTPGADAGAMIAWKQLELMRIAARDLAGLDDLEVVGEALSRLADDVITASLKMIEDGGAGLAVIGMGKLGANELNYASDVDLMFVGPEATDQATAAARSLMALTGTCYRVDLALRPEGRAGALVRSLGSYQAYWQRWVSPWELQALLKARPLAGDPALGAEWNQAAAAAIWDRPWAAAEIRQVREGKARTEASLSRRGLADREIKSGPGGIRDVEFSVQLLQLVHGRSDPALRVPATLDALAELARAGYVSPSDAAVMASSYRFLRKVEHRLQLAEELQVHSVPSDPLKRTHLARVLGYRDRSKRSALEAFDDDLRRCRSTAREVHERLYFRPLMEAFAMTAQPGPSRPGAPQPGPPPVPGMSPVAVSERLAAFGFSDAARTRAALVELTQGLTRSSRLMAQMLPLLLSWLADSPDPEGGLLRMRLLADGAHRRGLLVSAFRDSPLAASRLCLILGTSGPLHDLLRHEPELIATLGDDSAFALPDRFELVERARSGLRLAGNPGRALLRFKRLQLARIATRDLLGLDDVEATGAALSTLAEAVLEVALEALGPPVPMAIVAMGRLGGGELSYASDLDLMVVLGKGSEQGETAAEALLHLLHGQAEPIFRLDPNLRPEGRQGRLARSLAGYHTYYERWAGTWERQALVKARPVAGEAALGAEFAELVERAVWAADFGEEEIRQIRRTKARIERERVPPGEDPAFHLKLGPGALADVEWTVQLLQLEHKVRSPGTMDALSNLARARILDATEASALTDAYRRCEQIRNRWALMGGSPTDSLPVAANRLSALAHSLGTTPAELRQEYRRVTRRARAVVRGRFYGMSADSLSQQ